MNITQKNEIIYFYFILISLLGTIILLGLFFTQFPPQNSNMWQKSLIFSLFLLICILGIIAGIYPAKCLKVIKFKKMEDYESKNQDQEIKFEGHHPICENFKYHTFNFKKKTYCAGCSGLVTGAVLSILLIMIYLIYGLNKDYGFIIFIIGIISALISLLLAPFLNLKKNLYKFLINVFFVLGASLSIIGINSINSNLSIQLYFIILVIVWIVTRILISQETHHKICDQCLLESCNK